MLLLSLLFTASAPFAILGVTVGDTVNGAIVAGIFSVVNTMLNARLLRRVAGISDQVNATRKAGRDADRALRELADQHVHEIEDPKS